MQRETAIFQVTAVLLALLYSAEARGYGPGIAGQVDIGRGIPGINLRPTIGVSGIPGSYYGGGSVPGISGISGSNTGFLGGVIGGGRFGPGGGNLGGYPSGVGGVGPSYGGVPQQNQGSYQYPDGLGGSQFKTEENDGAGGVRGTYGYQDAQGLYRVVEYVADQYGFRAVVNTNEPGVDGKESPADVTMVVGQTPVGIQEQYTPVAGYGNARTVAGGIMGSGLRGGVGGLTVSPTGFVPLGLPSGQLGGIRGGLGYPQTGGVTRFPALGQTISMGSDPRGLGQAGSLGGLVGLTGRNYPGGFQGAIGGLSGPFSGINLSTSGKSIY